MKRASRFMVLTIAFDAVLLLLLGWLSPPGPQIAYAIVALFVVSPSLTYLVVYRDDYRRPLP